RIDMDELVVTGTVGELVDALLIDGQPLGVAQFLADVVLEFCCGYLGHRFSRDVVGGIVRSACDRRFGHRASLARMMGHSCGGGVMRGSALTARHRPCVSGGGSV